jgi:16S rRNA (guanine966-N2)-methyltransferase
MKMLRPYLEGASVVDLFAGSGALGLEALSRGAAKCDFVENNPAALHALKANIASLRARDRTRVFKRDAIQFAARCGEGAYDIALADPPYGSRKLDRIVHDWIAHPFSRWLAVEHPTDRPPGPRGKTVCVADSAVTLLEAPRRPPPSS